MSDTRQIVIEYIGRDRSASSTASSVESKFGKLGGKLDKVGQVAGKALAGGLLLAGAAAIKMGQSAAEDEAAASRLANTLRNTTGATDDQIASAENWISAQGKALGVTDDELRPALARLVTATHDVGKAQDLASLAMDASAGTGKSLESVSNALMKAQNGNVGALGKLGIATKDAAGKTLTMDQITRNMAKTFKGDAAKAAETTAGKQKILTVQLGELGEQIGAKLLPVMVKLSDIGLKMVDWVSQNTTVVGVFVAAVGGLAALLYTASLAMRAWVTIQKVWKAVTIVSANVQWALNAALAANPIGLVVVAIGLLVAGLIIAYKKSETFRNIVNGAFRAVWNAAKKAFGWVKQNWPKILAVLTGPIGIAVLLIIKHWDKIKAGAVAVLNWIKSGWRKVRELISVPIAAAKDAVVRSFGRIRDGAMAVVDWVKGIPDRFKSNIKAWAGAGRDLIGAFVDGMKNAAGIISGIAGNVWNAVKGMINSAIDRINSALNFTISLPGPDVHINAGNIPHLARGTNFFKGGMALVGEQGPELVTMPRGSKVTPNNRLNARGLASGDDGGVLVAEIYIDGQMIQRSLLKRKRLTGVDLGLT